MNIEEIKEQFETWEDELCPTEIVRHLLSIIEQAEKALDKSVEQMRDDGGAIGMETGYRFYDSEVIIQAIEALQAIRGN